MRPLVHSFRPLVLALLLCSTVASVEPVRDLRVTGRIADARTGDPLAGAQVHVPELGIGAVSGADGRYTFVVPERRLAGGEIRVVVRLIGYRAESAVLAPHDLATDSLTLDFQLEPSVIALQEVVVTGAAVTEQQARAPYPAGARHRIAADHSFRRGPWPPPHEREQYAHITENGFRSATDHPLSTFSIDVDRASYSNIRRFLLREGRLPPAGAVQVEEMVNYFPYTYTLPEGDDPVAITTELGRAPWSDDHHLLRVGLASRPIATADLPASNLVFLLDVSGSMQSPDKLPLVKRSMRLLVDQLREQDQVAIVVYAGAAGLVLEPTSGADRERILEAIDRLEAGGSTAGGAGLRLAYGVARRHFLEGGNNRVILATDGDFNVGESSDDAMVRLIEEKRREGTFLTVLGFGTGNLQSEKMQSLAQHGNGNYAYIDGLAEARKVLVGEMGGTLLTVAKDVKIQIEFNPARVASYRLIGYENRLLNDEDFNDDRKDAGELGAGHTVTALYEIVPVGRDDGEFTGIDPLRYQSSRRPDDPSQGDEVAFVRVRYKAPEGTRSRLVEQPVGTELSRGSTDFRFASAVAGFGMLLRESEHRGTISVDDVLGLARESLGADPQGYRRGFMELVEAYRRLTTYADDGGMR